MNDIIGIAWFKDERTYRRALAIFTDSENMPATYVGLESPCRKAMRRDRGHRQHRYSRDIDPEHLPNGAAVTNVKPIPRAERPTSTTLKPRISEDRQRNGNRIARGGRSVEHRCSLPDARKRNTRWSARTPKSLR